MVNDTRTHSMAGLPISRLSADRAVATVLAWARAGQVGLAVHFITAHTVSLAETNKPLRDILTSGDLLLPDSRWLHLLSGFRRRPVSQVRGPDFFRDALRHSTDANLRSYFVFPSEAVKRALFETLESALPGFSPPGFFIAPLHPLSNDESAELAQDIVASGAHLVWIGVGTPAQNFLANQLARATRCVVVGVGAAFEFSAGLKPEAPRWVSRIGLEWFFRLVSEPRRLWRRYLVGNTVFLYSLLRHHRSSQEA